MKSCRAAEPVTLLIVLAFLGATQLVPNWRLSRLFEREKKAPISQLQAAQAELEKVRNEAANALRLLEATKLAEFTTLKKQVQGAQQLQAGVVSVLDRIPAALQTRETKLAHSLSLRVSMRLTSAVGKLPQDQQDEIFLIIDQALSDAQEQIDAAEQKLRQKDAEAQLLVKEREALQTKIAILEPKTTALETEKAKLEATVTATTNQVVAVTQDLQAKERERGSLSAVLNNLWFRIKWGCLLVVGIYVFFVWIVPGLIKHMESGKLKTALRNTSGYLSSPLLFHDAKVKLTKATKPQN